jgi:dTDP-glucose 4,6-dehydratase
MKLLVTGGSGFIGSHFIRHMLTTYDDCEVVNIDALTYAGDPEALSEFADDRRYSFVHGDICDRNLVDTLVPLCDVIVHFAAESHVDKSIEDGGIFLKTNVVGTYTLLESARMHDKKRFHHVSTDEVFGQLGEYDEPFNELTPYDPRSPYSASKAASDHMVRAYFHTYGLPVTISNCSNNYGPYQFPEKLIPLAITNLIEGKSVPLYGDGKNIRDWLYVEDHCKALDIIIHNGKIGETYCIGGKSEKRNIEVVEEILEAMNKDTSSILYVGDRLGHDKRYAISYLKLEEELGWSPQVSFAEGLRRTVLWYTDNKEWWESKKF